MKWYKMHIDAMNDIKFKKLDRNGKFSLPIYWTAFCIMLDISARESVISYDEESDLEIIFEKLRFELPDLAELLTEMQDIDLIIWNTGSIQVKNWEKYQSAQYHSTERVQKHRANKEEEEQIDKVITEFNRITGKRFSLKTDETRKLIRGRFNEGRTVDELIAVIHWKQKDWSKQERMKQYVRPNTLFRPGNFDNYFNEIPQDIMKASTDGTLLKVRNLYGTIRHISQEQYDAAEEGFFQIID